MGDEKVEYDVEVRIEVAGTFKVVVDPSEVGRDETAEEIATERANDMAHDGEWIHPNSGFEVVDVDILDTNRVRLEDKVE